MKRSHQLFMFIFIFILGLWLGLTCFLDFYAVPTIFKTLTSRQDAGNLGMVLFYTFNKVEVLLALGLGVCAWFFKNDISWKKTFWTSITALFLLTLIYTFHMSPVIIESNKLKYQMEEGTPEYQALDQRHNQYHSLFRKTDGAKILILFLLLGSTLRRREEGEGERA